MNDSEKKKKMKKSRKKTGQSRKEGENEEAG